MATFRSILALSALSIALLACSEEDDAAPANAGGAPGSVATRAQSCSAIDKGAAAVVAQGAKQAASSAGAAGAAGMVEAGQPPSICDTLYTGCTDADLAALAPQYECFFQHSSETTEAILAACPSTAKLSDSCNASVDKALAPSKGPSGFSGPQACWDACACCMKDLNQPGIYNYNSKAECDFFCFWVWWAI